jgi:hypothetical protein
MTTTSVRLRLAALLSALFLTVGLPMGSLAGVADTRGESGSLSTSGSAGRSQSLVLEVRGAN